MLQRKSKTPSVSITHLDETNSTSKPGSRHASSRISTGKKKKKSSSSQSLSSTAMTVGKVVILIIQITFIIFALKLFSNTYTPGNEMENLLNQRKLELNSKEFKSLLNMLKTQPEMMDALMQHLPFDTKKDTAGVSSLLRGENKQNDKDKSASVLEKQLTHVREEIEIISRREVIEKFGEGPHRVEIELDFPNGDEGTIIFEMAPLSLMPHAVYHFLEMVRLQLLDGTSFHRNAGHVVQAGPTPPYANPKKTPHVSNIRGRFKRAGIGSVAFQEYSPEYPHVKYTIGFAGRPGGPDWYISTVDNTRNHGPGGQAAYEVKSEADPCFGRVVEGLDVVTKLLNQPVKSGGFKAMKENVGIVYARVL